MDTRQNSMAHEAVVGELLASAGVTPAYATLSEDEKVALLASELTSSRPLTSPYLSYSDKAQTELALVRMIASLHARFGPRCIPHYIISNCTSLSDLLEVAILLKEAGLMRVGPKDDSLDPASADPVVACAARLGVSITCAVDIIPLFETIGDLKVRGHQTLQLPRRAAYCLCPPPVFVAVRYGLFRLFSHANAPLPLSAYPTTPNCRLAAPPWSTPSRPQSTRPCCCRGA